MLCQDQNFCGKGQKPLQPPSSPAANPARRSDCAFQEAAWPPGPQLSAAVAAAPPPTERVSSANSALPRYTDHLLTINSDAGKPP